MHAWTNKSDIFASFFLAVAMIFFFSFERPVAMIFICAFACAWKQLLVIAGKEPLHVR
jgi:hypothetical protein